MTISLIIPIEGLMEMYAYPINPAREMDKRGTLVTVAVNMQRDNFPVGRVLYDYDAKEKNERATQATGLIADAYVQVMGDAMFDGLTERQAVDIMMEVNLWHPTARST